MKLGELIVEKEQRTDELLGGVVRGAGKALGGVAKGAGAIAGIGAGMKKAFQKGRQASIDTIGGKDEPDQPTQVNQPQGGGLASAFQQGMKNPLGGQQDSEEEPAKPSQIQDLQKRITALDPDSQKEVLRFLQKTINTQPEPSNEKPNVPTTEPATTQPATTQPATVDTAQMKKDRETANIAASAERNQQIKTTAAANAASAAERNEVEAAAKAAAAKSGFLRTPEDKLAIKRAQEMGIKVEDVEDDQTRIREDIKDFHPQSTRSVVKESQKKKQFVLFRS